MGLLAARSAALPVWDFERPGAGACVPACYGVSTQSNAEAWIWMEDVREYTDGGPAGTWPHTNYALAAERLGLFNGAYLTGQPIPQQPWLNQGDWRTRLQGGERYFGDLPSYRRHPLSLDDPDEQVTWLEQLWNRRLRLAKDERRPALLLPQRSSGAT